MDKKELCVICGKPTVYFFSTTISERIGYISGCGQVCKDCYEEMQKDEKGMPMKFLGD